jgi:hypothetical protein
MEESTKTKSLGEVFSTYKLPQFKEKKELKKREFINYRDELVTHFVEGINQLRAGTKFKPITKRTVALRLNRNPLLSKNDGEVAYLLKHCQGKKNYSKFFWVTNPVKK